ncbi:MAG: DNA repair protein RecN [Gammaproteobacteria bacterium]|nr:DNA repair protein RecN [Gammaproteobacteria bacterium]
MLQHIHIHHFAIVDKLALDFQNGMTVLTGETGAGKSILLDALGLALGDRAESGTIRANAERAEVSAEFDINTLPAVLAWLNEHELDDDGHCLIRRTVSKDGRSRGYINGRPVSMHSLRELGEQLVDIHGQHAHQSLLKRGVQRQTLDAFASSHDKKYTKLLDNTSQCFRQWQKFTTELTQLQASREQRDDRLELLQYQVEELRVLNLATDELAELESEHTRLANLNQLREGGESILAGLSNEQSGSIIDGLDHLGAELNQLQATDPALTNASETLQGAAIQAREAASELRDYLDGLSLDPERLQTVDERLALIHELARKHHLPPAELPSLLEQQENELTSLQNASIQLDEVASAVATAEKNYHISAKKLGSARRHAAKKLGKAVTDNMHQLGMPHGVFDITLDPLETFTANGLERVEFYVTTNPGQPVQPLGKVASGGELARISLAIQVIAAGSGKIPTLIFDEVDVGIGGGIAEVVGRLLRNLSEHRQVLCVTHQPQVASLAHQHLQVSKQARQVNKQKQETVADVSPISEQARVNEIARMLGGLEITEQTLSHAREMIERGQQTLNQERARSLTTTFQEPVGLGESQ